MPLKDSRIPDSSSTMRIWAILSAVKLELEIQRCGLRATSGQGVEGVARSSGSNLSVYKSLAPLTRRRGAHWCGHGFKRYWQLNHETAAHRFVFFHANGTMMIFHNPAHDGQAQSGASLLGREVGQEKSFLHIARNSLPGVGDDQFDGLATGDERGRNRNLPYDCILH